MAPDLQNKGDGAVIWSKIAPSVPSLKTNFWSVFGYFQLALEAPNNSAMPSAAHDMLSVYPGLRGELWIMV